MTPSELRHYRDCHRDGLLKDTVPFWFPRAIDPVHGGYFTSFDQDGSLLQTDKSIWFQGRAAWLLSTLHRTVEQRPEWLEGARSGIDFLDRHGFDADGRMFFSVTREGHPLRKRRYVFSECFAVIAYAAFGEITGDERHLNRAGEVFRQVLDLLSIPGALEPKVRPDVRPMKGLAVPMILLVTAQELRRVTGDPLCDEVIEDCIRQIERDFLKPEFRCLLETVGPQGEFIDTFEGRLVNPGHSIEAGWFILEESRLRGGDEHLLKLGTTIIDWSFEKGWDHDYGGMLYFVDAKGLPCFEYWHDMKFWWPHNETLIATLLAWRLTGEERYAHWHEKCHRWAYRHFPDPEFGEWFGYLHRDGSVSTRLKGNLFKGPFHLPRMQWFCWQLLEEVLAGAPVPPVARKTSVST